MQPRGYRGRYSSKSDQERQVRSIRATEEVWNAFGEAAESQGITRADLLEKLVELGLINQGLDLENSDSNAEVIAQLEEVLNSLDSKGTPLIELSNNRDKAPAKRVLKSLIDYLS